ncbi:MAG: hypothetical protein M1832_003876 [Thelocarpon impressellum]|nr:MAG: hypothetical protein M1832_003876 [Thelocarpon impressellum]
MFAVSVHAVPSRRPPAELQAQAQPSRFNLLVSASNNSADVHLLYAQPPQQDGENGGAPEPFDGTKPKSSFSNLRVANASTPATDFTLRATGKITTQLGNTTFALGKEGVLMLESDGLAG